MELLLRTLVGLAGTDGAAGSAGADEMVEAGGAAGMLGADCAAVAPWNNLPAPRCGVARTSCDFQTSECLWRGNRFLDISGHLNVLTLT